MNDLNQIPTTGALAIARTLGIRHSEQEIGSYIDTNRSEKSKPMPGDLIDNLKSQYEIEKREPIQFLSGIKIYYSGDPVVADSNGKAFSQPVRGFLETYCFNEKRYRSTDELRQIMIVTNTDWLRLNRGK